MDELYTQREKLLGSFLLFIQTFYRLRTGREFKLSQPVGRESHFITSARELTKVARGEVTRFNFNMPPRYGKTEMLIHFIAWTMAKWPDSNFLYVSYSHGLAKKQTQTVKQIIELPHYRRLFGVELSQDTSAKDNFETTAGGSVYAAGAMGTITGRGAGIRNIDRFGGCIAIDDIIKPAEALSDAIREGTNEWYFNTLLSRLNNFNTPILNIGQKTHEADLASILIKDPDYHSCILAALDHHNNALYPEMHTTEQLLKMKDESPYVFAAQYQQDPQPAGGGVFKPEWFTVLEEEPKLLTTFITIDTAETTKSYNDATVFSFWGLYRICQRGVETDIMGLHWIDCAELRIEPKDLKDEFFDFYMGCRNHSVKPELIAIEKKSTGVTLFSVLKDIQGLRVIDIERTKASGGKTERYLEIQPVVSNKRISLPQHSKHTKMCIEHMRKITANNSHRFDDIADTLYDAVKIGLIDQIVSRRTQTTEDPQRARTIMAGFNKLMQLKEQQKWQK